MVHKVALLIGGIGAAAVLALGLALGGFLNAGPVAADGALAGLDGVTSDSSPSPSSSPEATDLPQDARAEVRTVFVESGNSGPDRGPGSGGDDDRDDGDDRRGRDEDDDSDNSGPGGGDFDDDGFDGHDATNTGDTGTHGATGTHGGDFDTHGDADTSGGTHTQTRTSTGGGD
jgi:hypothetical protein